MTHPANEHPVYQLQFTAEAEVIRASDKTEDESD